MRGAAVVGIPVFPCVLSACLAASASAQVFELEAQNEATILDVATQAIGDGALFSGTSNNRLTKRALIRFDLSVLPAGDIVSATLELTPRAIRGPVPVSAFRLTRDWNEGPALGQGTGGGLGSLAGPDDVTWLVDGFGANWNNAGGDFDPVATDSATFTLLLTPVGFDVTQDVIDMIDGTVTNLGWILISDIEPTIGRVVSFGTDETPDPNPKLIVEVTPNCVADVNGDGEVTPTDFTAWVSAFNNNLPECDQNGDGSCTPTDFTAWVNNFNNGWR